MTASLLLAAMLGGCTQPAQGAVGSVGGNNGEQQAGAQPSAPAIDEATAKQMAFDHAGVAESDVDFLRVKTDRDDGRTVFDVEFYVAATGSEYDYEIDAATGEIVSYDYDAEHYQPEQAAGGAQLKTEQEIRDIALARVPGATEKDIGIKLERDDGRTLYEGKIVHDGMEYEFEIDAVDGTMREWKEEPLFD